MTEENIAKWGEILVVIGLIVICVGGGIALATSQDEPIKACTSSGYHYAGGYFGMSSSTDCSGSVCKIKCEDDNGVVHWMPYD